MYQSTKALCVRAEALINPDFPTGVYCSYALPIIAHGRLAIGVFYYPRVPHPKKRSSYLGAHAGCCSWTQRPASAPPTTKAKRRLANVMYLPDLGWVTRTSFPPSQLPARII